MQMTEDIVVRQKGAGNIATQKSALLKKLDILSSIPDRDVLWELRCQSAIFHSFIEEIQIGCINVQGPARLQNSVGAAEYPQEITVVDMLTEVERCYNIIRINVLRTKLENVLAMVSYISDSTRTCTALGSFNEIW